MTRADDKSAARPVRPEPKRRRLFLVVGVALVLAILLCAAGYLWLPVRAAYYTDANTIREPHATARLREILWQPPTPLPLPTDGADETYEPKLSADGLTLYFVRGKAGANADIYFCRKSVTGWSEPEPLMAVNSDYDDLGPALSADGAALYFYSDRPGGEGGYDLWMVRRKADGRSAFGDAANLGPAVNSPYNEYGPAMSPDGKTLYFSSNRPSPTDHSQPAPDAWPGTLREDLYHRDYDLYASAITESGFGRAAPLTALNTPHNEGAPAVSDFGDFLYFSSDRPGGSGGFDLYRSRRLKGEMLAAENLGAAVNTPANELDPGMSLGGFALNFSSDRPRDDVDRDRPLPYGLYQTASREVFREVETRHRVIAWAAIWSAVGRQLLWALLALLLLLLMLALLRDLRQRKLSLLARCLLTSLAAHLLLMFLLNVWDVGAAVAGEFRRRGVIRVSLSEGGVDPSAAAALIRGSFTEGQSATQPIEVDRTTVALPVEMSPPVVSLSPAPRLAVMEEPMAPDMPHDAPARSSDPNAVVRPVVVEWKAVSTNITSPQAPLPVSDLEYLPEMSKATPLEVQRLTADLVAIPTPVVSAPQQHFSPPRTIGDEAGEAHRVLDPRQVADAPLNAQLVSHAPPADVPTATGESWELTLPPAAPASDRRLEESQPMPSMATLDVHRVETRRDVLATAATELQVESLPAPESWKELLFDPGIQVAELGISSAQPSMSRPVVMTALPGRHAVRAESLPLAIPDWPNHSRAQSTEIDLAAQTAIDALERLRGAPTLPMQGLSVEDTPPVQPSPPELTFRSEAPFAGDPIASATPKDARLRSNLDLDMDWIRRDVLPIEPFQTELEIPKEFTPPTDAYDLRSENRRLEAVREHGGSDETEQAVARALAWLARHQSADGHWDGDGFDRQCRQCGGETSVDVDVALTGLSLLCFLAADHTHVEDGPYRATVERGLRWLKSRQDSDGDLRGPETMYSQGIAAIALSEALGMTGDPTLRDPVQRAIRFIEGARNRRDGGWRYDPGQPGDTSVLGWQVMALKSARLAGVEVSLDAFRAASHWLDRVADVQAPGRYAYQPGRPITPSMTAEGLFIQQLLGRAHDHPHSRDAAEYISRNPPDWSAGANTYYWYYATLALFQHQGEAWRTWNERMSNELLARQRTEGEAAGSWDPDGEWAPIGGRVYQTAICTLMLEVYYRYLPLYGDARPYDAIGTIRGRVSDASTGAPVAGAVVHLNLPDRAALTATVNAEGYYELGAPRVPDFIALSASREGYLPASANVASARLEGSALTVDFRLMPENSFVVALEAVPEVHHLGDDQFGGAINSQFQKPSEGVEFIASFQLSATQVRPEGSAEIRLMAKGVQVAHRLFVNGTLLELRLDESPRDGSFGGFRAVFEESLLRVGENEFRIVAGRRGSDVDDFEFVNVQIHLHPDGPAEHAGGPHQDERLSADGDG